MSLECSDGGVHLQDFATPYVFHGTSRTNSKVTVLASRITQEHGRLDVGVYAIVLGGHLDIAAASIVDVRFGFKELNSWIDRRPVMTEHNDDGSASAVITYTPFPSTEYVGGSATLELSSVLSLGGSYRSVISAREQVHLSLAQSQSLEDVLKEFVVPTEQAFSLTIGQRVEINALQLQSSDIPVSLLNGRTLPHLQDLYVFGLERGLKFEPEEQLPIGDRYRIREGPVPFDHTVRGLYSKWMQERQRYEAVAEAILSPGVDKLPPHARLVLICGGLEKLHAKLYPRFSEEKPADRAVLEQVLESLKEEAEVVATLRHITSLHFKPSSASRLKHLVCRLPDECQYAVTGRYTLETFVREVGSRRNIVAHTGARAPGSDITTDLCVRLELLARLSLLQDLGLRGQSLVKSMARDFRYRRLTEY